MKGLVIMKKLDGNYINQIKRALGAERVITMEGLPSQGPIDLLHLQSEVRRRLKSSGGRPTDSDWQITRMIRFSTDHWNQLEKISNEFSNSRPKVSPGQIASILIEWGLSQIERTHLQSEHNCIVRIQQEPIVPNTASFKVSNIDIVSQKGGES